MEYGTGMKACTGLAVRGERRQCCMHAWLQRVMGRSFGCMHAPVHTATCVHAHVCSHAAHLAAQRPAALRPRTHHPCPHPPLLLLAALELRAQAPVPARHTLSASQQRTAAGPPTGHRPALGHHHHRRCGSGDGEDVAGDARGLCLAGCSCHAWVTRRMHLGQAALNWVDAFKKQPLGKPI